MMEESPMKANTLFKTLLLGTAICGLTLSVAPQAYAQTVTLTDPMDGNPHWDTQGYYYSFWHDSVSGPSFTYGNGPSNGGNFSITWGNPWANPPTPYGSWQTSPPVGDFTCGLGWAQGWWYHSIGYNCGAFTMNGFGMFGVYGWFKHPDGSDLPDTEYYIVEMSAGQGPGGTLYGSVTTDGGTYDIYHAVPLNPNGSHKTGKFGSYLEQWISVRRGNNSVGINHTVTMANHFNAWQNLGWRQGIFDVQYLAVEGGYGGSGYVNATTW